jgi:hypothetical protein
MADQRSDGGRAGRLPALLSERGIGRWHWLGYPVALFLISRVALLALVQLSSALAPELFPPFREPPPGGIVIANRLCEWDCNWFAAIANDGYVQPRQTNFFPLLPILAGTISRLSGAPIDLALVLVANVASLLAFVVLYRLFLVLSDEAVARAGLALFAAYPFAFFQATGYPESLMVLATALALLLALQGRHILAGAALGVGVLARHLTLLGGASLLIAQVRQRPSVRGFLFHRGIIGLVLPWVGLGVYCLYQYLEFGDALTWYRARDGWGVTAWWGIDDLLADRAPIGPGRRVVFTYIPFALVVTLAAVALLRHRLWWESAAFGIVLLIVIWSVGVYALGRYSASCWPAFFALGTLLGHRPRLLLPVVVGFAMLQGMYLYLFVHRFPVL